MKTLQIKNMELSIDKMKQAPSRYHSREFSEQLQKLKNLLEPRVNVSVDWFVPGEYQTSSKENEIPTFEPYNSNKDLLVKMTHYGYTFPDIGKDSVNKIRSFVLLMFSDCWAIETMARWTEVKLEEIPGKPGVHSITVYFIMSNVLGLKDSER